jgi:hypothetical protein
MVAELLRPGESRQLALEGSPLFLTVKRHRPPSRLVRSSVTDYPVDERLKGHIRPRAGLQFVETVNGFHRGSGRSSVPGGTSER